jgi:hypothetical protein
MSLNPVKVCMIGNSGRSAPREHLPFVPSCLLLADWKLLGCAGSYRKTWTNEDQPELDHISLHNGLMQGV